MTFVNRIASAAALGAALLTGLTLETSPARAVPITYTLTATASGSLNGVAFNGATIVLTENSDTTTVTNPSAGFFVNIGTVTLTINGGVPVAFTDISGVFSLQTAENAGFADISTGFAYLGSFNNAFTTYDLTAAIGPVAATGIGFNPGTSFPTTGGDFILNGVNTSNTFTATIGVLAVPEPSSLALLGTGFAGGLVGILLFRRRLKTPARGVVA